MKFTRLLGPVLSWESQVVQYPVEGPPGIDYFPGEVPGFPTIDCLLWRGEDGRVVGILNHYGADMPPWEKAGNVNLWVEPGHQRQGIGRALVAEAEQRWGPINLEQQSYTASGEAFARSLLAARESA